MSRLLQWSPGATILIEIYINGQWVDITDYVLPPGDRGDQVKGSVGRQTELSRVDATNMSLTLENRDGRFTPGNLSSPLSPYWKSGVPIRWSETLGARTFRFPTMYVEIPEVQLTFQDPTDSTATDRVLRIQAVDLLTHLNRAPRFVSNLGAHILGQRKTSLIGYWPMTDAAEPFMNLASGAPVLRSDLLGGSVPPLDGAMARVLPAGGATILGDDRPGVRLIPARNATIPVSSYQIRTFFQQFPPVGAGKAITLVGWIDIDATFDDQIDLLFISTFDGALFLSKQSSTESPARTLYLTKPLGVTTGSVTSGSYPSGPGPHIVAIRYSPTLGTIEIWLDGLVSAGTLSGTLASDPVSQLAFGGSGLLGTLTHGQLYLGDASDFTNADFLAQWQRGLNGFKRQSVDQRIRSIATYAGLTDAQLDLEPSDSTMPEAAWAGQRPGDLATAAAVTGGGILFTRGEQLVYQDRKHRFNL